MVKTIVIDPGHGGRDVGAVGNGLKEKDIVLEIALQCKKYLDDNYTGHKTHLTRSTDVFIELPDRAAKANALMANVFCSIHINSSVSQSASGFETFVYNKTTSSTTKDLQKIMHKSILDAADYFKDRGLNAANFAVLRGTNMSAVLTESGFISNAGDAANLKKNAVISALAKGHALGLAQFLGLQKKQPAAPKTTYQVVIGEYATMDEAKAIQKSLETQFRNVSINQTKA